MSTKRWIIDAFTAVIAKENEDLEVKLAIETIAWKEEQYKRLEAEKNLDRMKKLRKQNQFV